MKVFYATIKKRTVLLFACAYKNLDEAADGIRDGLRQLDEIGFKLPMELKVEEIEIEDDNDDVS